MTHQFDFERLRLAQKAVRAELISERSSSGNWIGQISGSPVATAEAICALVLAHDCDAGTSLLSLPSDDERNHDDGAALDHVLQCDLSELIVQSLHWLAQSQNEDGGWGDAARGKSNIAATLLVQAAFRLTGVPAKYADLMDVADEYVERHGGVSSLWAGAGNEKAMVAPVLATCALAGMVPWRQVPALPFELACLPQPWSERLHVSLDRLEIPSLIAIGLAKLFYDRPKNPLHRMLRNAMRSNSLAIASQLQAPDGSFFSSVPHTAVVVMGLASVGHRHHAIVERGVEFLLATMRSDASWPIVPNLSITNTTLVLNEAADGAFDVATLGDSARCAEAMWHPTTHFDETVVEPSGSDETVVSFESHFESSTTEKRQTAPRERSELPAATEPLDAICLQWLVDSQRASAGALPGTLSGGWAWSDTPGALPNTADTASVVTTLSLWLPRVAPFDRQPSETAARAGINWLLAAQGDDGGWPLWQAEQGSENQSAPDLTARALRALGAWQRQLALGNCIASPTSGTVSQASDSQQRLSEATRRGLTYLAGAQRSDGSFAAAQFANSLHHDSANPVIGTSLVLEALGAIGQLESEIAIRGARWLVSAQHAGGGWGPPRAPLDYSGAYKNGAYTWRENDVLAKHCTIEETSAAVSALLPMASGNDSIYQAALNGLKWLADAFESDQQHEAALIGFSFAKLWYRERLFPLAMANGALVRAMRQLAVLQPSTASVG